MKKTMAYAATAILLGFTIMMVPLALRTGPPTYRPDLQPNLTNAFTERADMKSEDSSLSRSFGLASQPSNLLPSTLIFFSGLIAAIGVYAMLKKRIV